MINSEVVNEVRTLLFHLLKSYMKVEDKTCIVNPSNVSLTTVDFLNETKHTLEEYIKTLDDFTAMVTAMVASSILEK